MNRNEQIDEAKRRLELIGVDFGLVVVPFLQGNVMVSENISDYFNAILYNVDNYDCLKERISEFEKEFNSLVYHVQLSHLEFGDCYSFFYVSNHKDEWEMDVDDINYGQPLVYVWNKTIPHYSEFGSIGIKTSMGGVVRTY